MNSPLSKSDYLDKSAAMSLGARCPLLGRCERRAQTIALANDEDLGKSRRLLTQSPVIGIIGEGPSKVGGSNNFGVTNLCPEVSAFEPTGCLVGFRDVPITSGNFDAYFPNEKYRPLETAHYSQCAEYCAQPAATSGVEAKRSWLTSNYQWLIGTAIALAGTVAAYLALK